MELNHEKLTQEGAQAPSLPATPANAENAPRLKSGAANVTPLPIIAASWAKNGRETLQIRLGTYQGRTVLDLRTWYPGDDGTLRPAKGLTVSIKHLPALATGLADALAIALKSGLLEGSDQ